MDMTALTKNLKSIFYKYKYVILIIALGFVLLLIPNKSNTESHVESVASDVVHENSVDKELAALLSQVKGAGNVKVYLTIANGTETVYQTNEDYSQSDTNLNRKIETVKHTDSERNEEGLIKQINPPTYLGAIIVCQGADNPAVKLALVNAVSNATGLGTDRISVLKMK